MMTYKLRRRWLPTLLAALSATLPALLGGCSQESPVAREGQEEGRAVELRISTPYEGSGGSTRAGEPTDETVRTVDVLVLTGSGAADYVLAVVKGEPVAETTNRFKIVLPVGVGLDLHVFVNCRDALTDLGFFQSMGKRRDFILPWLTLAHTGVETTTSPITGANVLETGLPMYGVLRNQTVSTNTAGNVLGVHVLRSMASAQVLVNATENSPGSFTGGTLPEFELRECYAYFQSLHGRVLPTDAAGFDGTATGTVNGVSLPQESLATVWKNGLWVDEARANLVEVVDLPVSTTGDGFPDYCYKVGTNAVTAASLPPLYLFENKAYTADGNDSKGNVVGNANVATTRLVVGGVYKGADPANTRVTYYRLNFLSDVTDRNSCRDLLRNHRYLFNIKSVTGPGYDTPNAAATGVPVDIDVSVIDWTPENTEVDFDSQNYLSLESKRVALPRKANTFRTVRLRTSVAAADWKMSLDRTTWVTGATVANSDFSVTRTTVEEGSRDKVYTLKFVALRNYNSSAPQAGTLYIQAKNLFVSVSLAQEDVMPDDWGTGSDEGVDLTAP